MAMNICPVHHAMYEEGGSCVWCRMASQAGVEVNPAKMERPAKPITAEEHVASYERPWGPPPYQPALDRCPAASPHSLQSYECRGRYTIDDFEWGDMQVRGDAADAFNRDYLGWLVLGVNEDGEPTAAIR